MSKGLIIRIKTIKYLSALLIVLIVISMIGTLKTVTVVNAATMKVANNINGKTILLEKDFDKIELTEKLQNKTRLKPEKEAEERLKRSERIKREEERKEALRKEEEEKKKEEARKKEEEKRREEEKKIAQEKDDTVWATDSLNYREGPGTDYKKIGNVKKGTSLHRIGICNNGWLQVEIDGNTYYVSNDFVTENESVSLKAPSGTKGDYQAYAYSLFPKYGWGESELNPLILLWERESGWNPLAHNSYSGAHGIPQSLPASKMASHGSDYYDNGYTQIRWGLDYINSRYGSPSSAWAHSESVGWY